jgi:hypothetical protein
MCILTVLMVDILGCMWYIGINNNKKGMKVYE